jgi:DNA polymerase theta
MIGEESRGYLLEIMLTKLQYLSKVSPSNKIKLLAMSATLPNLKEIAVWLDSSLFVTNFRPVMVKEYIKIGNELLPVNQDNNELIKINGNRKIQGDRIGLYGLLE